jgi:hypothetical protein
MEHKIKKEDARQPVNQEYQNQMRELEMAEQRKMIKCASVNVLGKRNNNITSEQEAIKIIMRGQGQNMFGGYKPVEPHKTFY